MERLSYQPEPKNEGPLPCKEDSPDEWWELPVIEKSGKSSNPPQEELKEIIVPESNPEESEE